LFGRQSATEQTTTTRPCAWRKGIPHALRTFSVQYQVPVPRLATGEAATVSPDKVGAPRRRARRRSRLLHRGPAHAMPPTQPGRAVSPSGGAPEGISAAQGCARYARPARPRSPPTIAKPCEPAAGPPAAGPPAAAADSSWAQQAVGSASPPRQAGPASILAI